MSGASPPDDRLARLAAAGDRPAFEAIYDRHHQALYRYCSSILGDPQEAQDALQSTMERALRSIGGQRVAGGLKAWLFGIAHNEAMDTIGRRPAAAPAALRTEAPDAAVEAAEHERLRQLVADLATLPERQRAALVLRELSGLDSEEIGGALSISPSAAKQSVYEARVALTAVAAGRDMSCDGVQRRISEGDGRRLRGRGVRAHLRSCRVCQTFKAAIDSRTADFPVLFPPLAAAAAAKTLAAVTGGAGASGADGVAALSGPDGSATAGGGASSEGEPTAAGSGTAQGGETPSGGSLLRDRRAITATAALVLLLLFTAGLGTLLSGDTPKTARAPSTEGPPTDRGPARGAAGDDPAKKGSEEGSPGTGRSEPPAARGVGSPGPPPSATLDGYSQLDPSVAGLLADGSSGGPGSATSGAGATAPGPADGGSVAGASPGSADVRGSLAFTGTDVLIFVGAGLGLLGLGALMRRLTRRPLT